VGHALAVLPHGLPLHAGSGVHGGRPHGNFKRDVGDAVAVQVDALQVVDHAWLVQHPAQDGLEGLGIDRLPGLGLRGALRRFALAVDAAGGVEGLLVAG